MEPRPGGEAGWVVRQEDGGLVAEHPHKDVAIEDARRRARRHPLAQVKVHDASGRFETEWTYGEDPRSHPG